MSKKVWLRSFRGYQFDTTEFGIEQTGNIILYLTKYQLIMRMPSICCKSANNNMFLICTHNLYSI